jgi:glutathione S-transferase
MYACLFGDDESKAKGKEQLGGKITPLLEGIERQYNCDSPFLYSSGEGGPRLGDLAVYNLVESPFPGLKALGFDLSPFNKITATSDAVKAFLEAGEKPKPVDGPGPEVADKPELIYFAAPGRGELARLAFAAGGVDFTDTRLTFEQWPAVKQDSESVPGKMFGSMPVIKHGNFLLAQSMSISQYAADLGINVVHSPSPFQRGLDTMMMGAHADLQVAMYACLFGDDESKAKGKEQLSGKVTPILEGIERQYKAEGPFLYDKESLGPSLGDLALLDVVTSPFPGLKALGIDLSPFQKVLRCVEACEKSTIGTLAAYLQSRS